jgi:hypothetical protein
VAYRKTEVNIEMKNPHKEGNLKNVPQLNSRSEQYMG